MDFGMVLTMWKMNKQLKFRRKDSPCHLEYIKEKVFKINTKANDGSSWEPTQEEIFANDWEMVV